MPKLDPFQPKQGAGPDSNPIDKDKIAENPHNLPYAHSVASLKIEPNKEGAIKGMALSAMYEQTGAQMSQIQEQVRTLFEQAQKLKERVRISELIYEAEIRFEPVIGQYYHLYQRSNESHVLSMVAPKDWGKNLPFEVHVAEVRLLADHSWDVAFSNKDSES